MPVGRYLLFDVIGTGGMATVHVGRLVAAGGFARLVAIKRLHPHLAHDPELSRMLTDEARMVARLQHPNVVSTLDVMAEDGELFVVMELVRGISLAALLRILRDRDERVAQRIAVSIAIGVLEGLQAAHDATSETGAPLELVHRDVSPKNVLLGTDGVARVLDFGIAKAAGREQLSTSMGQVKGTAGYMSPEQIRGEAIDRRSDVYAAGIVLWELLTGERLFLGDNVAATLTQALVAPLEAPSARGASSSAALDQVVLRALSRDMGGRFSTAKELVAALEQAVQPARSSEVAAWVASVAAAPLARQAAMIARVEGGLQADTGAVVTGSGEMSGVAEASAGLTLVSDSVRPARRRLAFPIAVSALGAVVALSVTCGVIRMTASEQAAASSTPTTGAVELAAPTAPTAPAAAQYPLPVPLDTDAAASTASSVALAAPVASATPRTIRTTRPALPSRAAPSHLAASARAACNPPFTVDADGIRHAKRECF